MEKIISMIYMFLGKAVALSATFPGSVSNQDQVVALAIGMIMIIISLILVFRAVSVNNGYNFLIRLLVVNIPTAVISYYAMMCLSGADKSYVMKKSTALILAGVLAGSVLFIVVNFLLEHEKGIVSVILFGAGMFAASAALRLWNLADGTNAKPVFRNIMYFSLISDPVKSMIQKAGLSAFTGVLEFIMIMLLLMLAIMLVFKSKNLMPEEWMMGLISQILPAIAYLGLEAHAAEKWNPQVAYFVFFLAIVGDILFLFVFWYQVSNKTQEGTIGAFWMILGGAALRCAIVLGTSVARDSFLGKFLGYCVDGMNYIYNFVPVGAKTQFNNGNPIMSLLGVAVALLIALILIIIIYLILGRVFDFEGDGAGMGVGWFRTCSLIMIIPLIVYWVGSMNNALLASNYDWIMLALKSLTCIGFAVCCANIAPSLFSKGFLGQLKLVLISTIVSVTLTCILTAIIFKLV